MSNEDVTPNETTQLLKELITDLIRKAGTLHVSWKKAGRQLGNGHPEDRADELLTAWFAVVKAFECFVRVEGSSQVLLQSTMESKLNARLNARLSLATDRRATLTSATTCSYGMAFRGLYINLDLLLHSTVLDLSSLAERPSDQENDEELVEELLDLSARVEFARTSLAFIYAGYACL